MQEQAAQSVANKLIKRISVYCAASELAVGVVEGWYAWRHLSEDFDQGLQLIAQSQLPLLAISVWEAEPLVIQRQLVQISQQPSIGYVRLRADIGAVFEVGNGELHNHCPLYTSDRADETEGVEPGGLGYLQKKKIARVK